MIIKKIESIEEIKEIAAVEAQTWGMQPGNTVPDHVLTAISREGGLLLGAYLDGHLVGFTLGWLGSVAPTTNSRLAAKRLKLVSHMTGVLPEFRDQRIGYRLKLAQRDWALARGLDLITWTYDPLESRNGYFNIHLLGCTCQTYLEDYYGSMSDQMNAGIPSDRFRVDWRISRSPVERVLNQERDQIVGFDLQEVLKEEEYQLLNPALRNKSGLPRPGDAALPARSSQVLVEIPDRMQEIRIQNPSLALAWRLHTREIFQQLFLDNFQVIDFYYLENPFPRSFYSLEKTHAD